MINQESYKFRFDSQGAILQISLFPRANQKSFIFQIFEMTSYPLVPMGTITWRGQDLDAMIVLYTSQVVYRPRIGHPRGVSPVFGGSIPYKSVCCVRRGAEPSQYSRVVRVQATGSPPQVLPSLLSRCSAAVSPFVSAAPKENSIRWVPCKYFSKFKEN